MAKAENDKGPRLNGEEAPSSSPQESGDTATVPSSSSQESQLQPSDSEASNGDDRRGVKRRASVAFSEDDAEFAGFHNKDELDDSLVAYDQILQRLEEEVSSATVGLTPTKLIIAAISNSTQLNKRSRQETDGSRPSSSLSMRSDGSSTETTQHKTSVPQLADGMMNSVKISSLSSPQARARRSTVEMSSPLLRVPMERGWRRELVFRAAVDHHSRRAADIYYYTPAGKKLRSSREVSENLSGTGLTLENFSFFKEPIGLDDPEKEIIRDAKLMRRNESPVPSPVPVTTEGKRIPKPKAPKGVSPEPFPQKIKVKSFGSRITTPTQVKQIRATKPANTTPSSDNNNTSAWKKPRLAVQSTQLPPRATGAPTVAETQQPPRQLQPCSMMCTKARGAVPTLACVACLCLYHAVCAGALHEPKTARFLCKNCRSSSPPADPLKAGGRVPNQITPTAAVAPTPPDKRLCLRMKKDRGGPGMWSVARPHAANMPQGLAVIGGKRFIVVPSSSSAQTQ